MISVVKVRILADFPSPLPIWSSIFLGVIEEIVVGELVRVILRIVAVPGQASHHLWTVTSRLALRAALIQVLMALRLSPTDPAGGDASEGSSLLNHTRRHKVGKISRDAILVRIRQEETRRDSVRELLPVGVLYLHR